MLKKKILITGGTGFIGKHLIQKISETDFEPILLIRPSSDKSFILEKNYKYYELNSSFSLDQLFSTEKIEVIVHLASDTRKNNDVLSSTESNIVFPMNLIKTAKKFGVSKFINTGTTHYSSEENIYSLSKKYFRDSLKFSDCTVFDFELDNVYGENDHANRFIMFVLSSFLKKEKEINLTEGKQVRDFVHVDDVVSLLITSINKIMLLEKSYHSFSIGSGKPLSVKEVVLSLQAICKGESTKLNFGVIPYEALNQKDLLSKIDILPTQEFFNWQPQVQLTTGLQRLAQWAQRGSY